MEMYQPDRPADEEIFDGPETGVTDPDELTDQQYIAVRIADAYWVQGKWGAQLKLLYYPFAKEDIDTWEGTKGTKCYWEWYKHSDRTNSKYGKFLERIYAFIPGFPRGLSPKELAEALKGQFICIDRRNLFKNDDEVAPDHPDFWNNLLTQKPARDQDGNELFDEAGNKIWETNPVWIPVAPITEWDKFSEWEQQIVGEKKNGGSKAKATSKSKAKAGSKEEKKDAWVKGVYEAMEGQTFHVDNAVAEAKDIPLGVNAAVKLLNEITADFAKRKASEGDWTVEDWEVLCNSVGHDIDEDWAAQFLNDNQLQVEEGLITPLA